MLGDRQLAGVKELNIPRSYQKCQDSKSDGDNHGRPRIRSQTLDKSTKSLKVGEVGKRFKYWKTLGFFFCKNILSYPANTFIKAKAYVCVYYHIFLRVQIIYVFVNTKPILTKFRIGIAYVLDLETFHHHHLFHHYSS